MRKMIHIATTDAGDQDQWLSSSVCGVVEKPYNGGKDLFVPITCRKLTFSKAVYDTCEACFNHPSLVLLDLAESDL